MSNPEIPKTTNSTPEKRNQADRQDEVRRVQTGAIGIVSVLLLIGLASTLGTRGVGGNSPDTNAAGATAATSATGPSAAAQKSEPLVELGVQPSTGDVAKPPLPNPAAATPAQGTLLPPSAPVPIRADGSVPDLKPDPKAQKAVRPN